MGFSVALLERRRLNLERHSVQPPAGRPCSQASHCCSNRACVVLTRGLRLQSS